MKSQFIHDAIHCVCGNSIDVSALVDDVSSDARLFGGNDQGEDTFTCESCEREHKLSIEVYVEVIVHCQELTTTNALTEHKDKNGNELKVSYFENVRLGDKTPNLYDGQYEVESIERIFDILNGEVANIFSSRIDPNQMSLFDESAAI